MELLIPLSLGLGHEWPLDNLDFPCLIYLKINQVYSFKDELHPISRQFLSTTPELSSLIADRMQIKGVSLFTVIIKPTNI
jgi:hypothetical protein